MLTNCDFPEIVERGVWPDPAMVANSYSPRKGDANSWMDQDLMPYFRAEQS
jgi:hypothetical protein